MQFSKLWLVSGITPANLERILKWWQEEELDEIGNDYIVLVSQHKWLLLRMRSYWIYKNATSDYSHCSCLAFVWFWNATYSSVIVAGTICKWNYNSRKL